MFASRNWIGVIAAGALFLPSGLKAQTSPVETEQRTVVTEKSAYIALPPELVAEPVVTELTVSNGGRYALAQRTRLVTRPETLERTDPLLAHPQKEVSLVLWDSRTHLRTTVWHADEEEAHIERVTWLPTTEVAFAQVNHSVPVHPEQPQGEKTQRSMLLRIAPATGRADVVDLSSLGQIDLMSFAPLPSIPLGLVSATRIEGAHEITSLSLLDETGRVDAHVDLPENVNVLETQWTKNNQPLIHIVQRSPSGKGVTATWLTMNTQTGELSALPNQPKTPKEMAELVAAPKPAAALPLRLKTTRTVVSEAETTQTAGLLWLESVSKSEKPRILLSSDCNEGQFMARGQIALFQSQGAVWATPLMPIDLAAYAKLKAQADRILTMNRARQAALALLLFAQDNDETLPNGEGLVDNLLPYTLDPSVLDGFNYTYPGGPLSDIANPSQQVVGAMSGANGQAILFADGHVEWH